MVKFRLFTFFRSIHADLILESISLPWRPLSTTRTSNCLLLLCFICKEFVSTCVCIDLLNHSLRRIARKREGIFDLRGSYIAIYRRINEDDCLRGSLQTQVLVRLFDRVTYLSPGVGALALNRVTNYLYPLLLSTLCDCLFDYLVHWSCINNHLFI